jgi:hypothetical protein
LVGLPWITCFVGKYSQKLLRSGKLNPVLLNSTNFFIHRENQKNIFWEITLGSGDDNFADSLKILPLHCEKKWTKISGFRAEKIKLFVQTDLPFFLKTPN